MIDEITILIKTFKRPNICQRLINSIRDFYPEIKIFVLDDDENETNFLNIDRYIKTEFDIGISAGRNRLVNECETPYCMILDDDCIFLKETNIASLIKELKDRDLDILQPKVIQDDVNLKYQGIISIDGTTIKHTRKEDGLMDYVLNIFIAKTDTLKKYKWDERFKTGEHAQYFFDHKGKMKIGVSDVATIEHKHFNKDDYNEYRNKAYNYIKMGLKKDGFTRRIDAHGNVIKV